MQEHPPDPPKPEDSLSATGSWRPSADRPTGDGTGAASDDSPTVHRPGGSASGSETRPGSGSRPAAGPGGGVGRGPMQAGLPINGDRLDSFEVQQAIGVGGMGAVFRALDVRLDRFVALKVLPPGQANEAENVRRFYQEGRAAARLDHENIARVFTIGQDKGLHFIAFEYIEGTTIRQRVEQHGILPVAEAINFTLQIAGALVHASERGVIHRDIKPSNIIVTPHGRAKLVDMGLARRFEREGADDGLTQSNMTLGTFDYISPEQARDPRAVDVRSDLYSLGCTIYHMLTGQPPFPGGTVLQKLLSHREEPAPDVRGLNPAVPADLAAIVLKLMAKDPDRRYQAPEQLVRDLLTLAGALGLRSISPEGLVWMNAAPRPPGWERHLFWGLPAAALAVVVLVLTWMGREQADEPGLPLSPDDLIGSAASSATTSGTAAPDPDPDSGSSSATTTPEGSVPTATPPDIASADPRGNVGGAASSRAPRERRVRSDEDLRAVLRSEPPGSTVLLADDGPYRLSPAPDGTPPIRADLTIRADVGTDPVIEAAPGDPYSVASGPLLHFAGGRVAMEGLTFKLAPGGAGTGPAVRAEGTALTLSRCLVQGAGRPSALELIAPPQAADTTIAATTGPMPVLLENCSIGGGGVGILARGPMTLALRDCAIATRGPAVWFNNIPGPSAADAFGFGPEPEPDASAAPTVAARLMLDHVSLLVGAEPVLRFDGTSIRAEVYDSLVAPPRELDPFASGPPTLVAIDDPDRLRWMGIGNLYARIGAYLVPTADPKGRPRVFEYDAWVGPIANEAGSRPTTQHVWAEPDPGAALARGLPASEAFRPAVAGVLPGDRDGPGPSPTLVGSRRGPSGPIEPVAPAIAVVPAAPRDSSPGAEAARLTGFDPNPMTPGPMALAPEGAEPSRPRPSEPVEGEAPPPVPVARLSPSPDRPGIGGDPATATDAEPTDAAPAPADVAGTAPAPADAGDEDDEPIRTEAQFLDRLARLGPKGGELVLANDAQLDLPPRVISGSGIVEIAAEPGPSRPLLRLRDTMPDPASPGGWSYLFRVDREGELYLRGVDLVLEDDAAPADVPRAAFGLGPDATLELSGCTVTVDGPSPSAVVRLLGPEPGAPHPTTTNLARPSDPPAVAPAGAAAHVRIIDSLLRCADDAVDVDPDAQLDDLKLTNVVVASAGSLLHGHGHALPPGPGPVADDEDGPLLVLALRRATVVAHGGIVRLDSTADRPALPLAEVSARESILATGPDGDALFRVEVQGELVGLSDRIRVVESRGVAYHQIDEYRRDESSRLDIMPMVLHRDDWAMAVGRTEVDARHDDAGFLADPGPEREPWDLQPDDVRLDPDGLAADLGPDLDRIPRPPDSPPVADSLRGRSRAEILDRIRRLLPTIP